MSSFVLVLSLVTSGSGVMSRFALTDLLAATGGRVAGFNTTDASFAAVSTDSRTVRWGELFWALRGDQHDGHEHVQQALVAGASASVVDGSWADRRIGPRIVVPNTRAALLDLARWYRSSRDALVVGITGSVGKTTTRDLVHAVLGSRFDGVRSPRNFNNEIGLPLSLLQLEEEHEYAVVEIGASARGEIARLADVARPDVSIVTRVAAAHLAGFGSIESIAAEKGALVEHTADSGFVVLNGDDLAVRAMRNRTTCPAILVGVNSDNTLRADVESVALGRLRMRVDGTSYSIPVTGRHHVVPVLAAIAVGREIGLSTTEIADGLASFEPVEGRSRIERIGPWTVVDDTYNASPASMAAACELLAECPADGPRILVAADMLDLGDDADRLHTELGRTVAEAGIDHLLFHGARAERVATEARHRGMDAHRLAACPELDALTAALDCLLEPGAVVVVKGSRAMRMERVVAWLRDRAKDRQVAPVQKSARVPARAA